MKKRVMLLGLTMTATLFGSHKVKIKNKSGEPLRATIQYGDSTQGKYDTLFLNVGMEKKVSIHHDDREGFCCPNKIVVEGIRSQSRDAYVIQKKCDEHKFTVHSDKKGNIYVD